MICGLFPWRAPSSCGRVREGLEAEASDVVLFNRRRLLADRPDSADGARKTKRAVPEGQRVQDPGRNFSCRTGELDLVMVDLDGVIVFVEVKTLPASSSLPPRR